MLTVSVKRLFADHTELYLVDKDVPFNFVWLTFIDQEQQFSALS
jgi:hypothetical protein